MSGKNLAIRIGVTGTIQEGSDIDLFVISTDWVVYSQRERLEMLGFATAWECN